MSTDTSSAAAAVAYHRSDLFPVDALFRFANLFRRRNDAVFTEAPHREWAARVDVGNGDAQVWRNQGFSNADELRRFLMRHRVVGLDLGPFLNVEPALERIDHVGAHAVWRELVVDIDASDYEHRDCGCAPKQACRRCWRYVACAAECVDHVLRHRLGYERVLWVFSGNRGAHAWVLDRGASFITADSAYRRLLEHELAYLARVVAGTAAARRCDKALLSVLDRWNDDNNESESKRAKWLPRIDAGVSAHPTHLLRAPFSAHAGRYGAIALPMPLDELVALDPAAAPTSADVEAVARCRRYFEAFMDGCLNV